MYEERTNIRIIQTQITPKIRRRGNDGINSKGHRGRADL